MPNLRLRTRSIARAGLSSAKAFLRDRRGGVLATLGLATPLLMGAAAIGVETGMWYGDKRDLQTAADAAALSGAFERARGTPGQVDAAAQREAERNGFEVITGNAIEVNNPPISGPRLGEAQAVEVTLQISSNLLFASLFMDHLAISARAVGEVQTVGEACVLALHETASLAIRNQGSSYVDMSGCVLAANSNSATAISITGSGYLDAESLWTVGGVDQGGSSNMILDRPPTVNAWALDDPYADLVMPGFSSTCILTSANVNNTTTLGPGTYCSGITFGSQANVTLQPGTYYIDKGNFRANAGARIRCPACTGTSGVTFVLTSSGANADIGTVTINGGADIDLHAPTGVSDPFKGILFYQDSDAPLGADNKFNGGSSMVLTGAIYFPRQDIEWSGNNNSALTTCTQIIGQTVTFIGNSTIYNTGCEAAGVEPLEIVGVELVE